MMRQFRSARRSAVLAATVLALGACSDDEGHEVEVESMRITVGGQVINVNATGAVTGGPIALVNGVGEAVTVEFLDAGGGNALVDHADDFQANITTPAGVTFTRTGPFAGTLTGTAVGTVNVAFELFHIEENHEDFGPFNVQVQVTGATIVAK